MLNERNPAEQWMHAGQNDLRIVTKIELIGPWAMPYLSNNG